MFRKPLLLYHIPYHGSKVLDKLVAEIDEVLERFDGKLDHETVAEMPYLEACIKETLRWSHLT